MSCTRFVLLLGLCACTQDFNKFLGDGGGNGEDAASCTVAQTCLGDLSTCGQACISGYNTCTSGCGNSQSCKAQCKNQEGTCQSVCVSACVSCADAGTCAQTPCQSALP